MQREKWEQISYKLASSDNDKENVKQKSNYLLLTQPLTPKAPLRFLELIKEYCTFDLAYPLNVMADSPLKEDSIFFNPPFHFILNTDLEAVNLLVSLPFASTLTPLTFLCFIELST